MYDWVEQSAWASAALYRFRATAGLVGFVLSRMSNDRLMRIAAGLSYTSLLSAVPMLTIAFAIFSAFPIFEDTRQQIESLVFDNFAPHAGDAVSAQLSGFISNAGQMTAVGIVALAVTALMTLITIENTFNHIWRVQTPRGPVQRVLMYWTLLTCGPLLLGMSLSVSGYVFAQAQIQDVPGSALFSPLLSSALPFLLQTAAFTLMYVAVPNHHVRKTDALVGGLVAGILFALLKTLFGWYVANFPSYQSIYGALSTIPLFMIWMYLAWAVVLMGAEITAALPEWRSRADKDQDEDGMQRPGARLAAAILILERLWRQTRSQQGGAVRQTTLADAVGPLSGAFWPVMAILEKEGFIQQTGDNGWVLARDLDTLSVNDMSASLAIDCRKDDLIALNQVSWGDAAINLVHKGEQARHDIFDRSLLSLWQTDNMIPLNQSSYTSGAQSR